MNSFDKSQFSQSSSTLPQPPLETISRFYQPQKNSKTFRFIIVIAYVFCVSLAAIILSFYYMFFWDSTMPPVYKPKANNCGKYWLYLCISHVDLYCFTKKCGCDPAFLVNFLETSTPFVLHLVLFSSVHFHLCCNCIHSYRYRRVVKLSRGSIFRTTVE